MASERGRGRWGFVDGRLIGAAAVSAVCVGAAVWSVVGAFGGASPERRASPGPVVAEGWTARAFEAEESRPSREAIESAARRAELFDFDDAGGERALPAASAVSAKASEQLVRIAGGAADAARFTQSIAPVLVSAFTGDRDGFVRSGTGGGDTTPNAARAFGTLFALLSTVLDSASVDAGAVTVRRAPSDIVEMFQVMADQHGDGDDPALSFSVNVSREGGRGRAGDEARDPDAPESPTAETHTATIATAGLYEYDRAAIGQPIYALEFPVRSAPGHGEPADARVRLFVRWNPSTARWRVMGLGFESGEASLMQDLMAAVRASRDDTEGGA